MYKDIEEKYINAEIQGHYKFKNADEVKKVLGYDIRSIDGFKDLSIEHKTLAEKLICGFINGHGLQAREDMHLIRVTRVEGKFKLKMKDSFSYLYDNGEIG